MTFSLRTILYRPGIPLPFLPVCPTERVYSSGPDPVPVRSLMATADDLSRLRGQGVPAVIWKWLVPVLSHRHQEYRSTTSGLFPCRTRETGLALPRHVR